MKHLLLCALLAVQYAFATHVKPSVKAQLEQLNRYWKVQDLDYPVLQKNTTLDNEVVLIQTHLSLVELTLRNKNTLHLTATQRANRFKCLDILHAYWEKGIFPKNTFHTSRTPYFIDVFGTACAVGQLIISTGYEDFAQKVKKEHNNGYIVDLNAQYPELGAWANESGFSVEELAWIQPCYCFTSSEGKNNVSCYGGNDGYWMPNTANIPKPFKQMMVYRWMETDSDWGMLMCGGPCNLSAGKYKMVITDASDKSHTFFETLTQPAAPDIQVNVSEDAGGCNGTAVASISGGFPPYMYNWSPGNATYSSSNSKAGLCATASNYYVKIQDSKSCYYLRNFSVGTVTGIDETSFGKPNVFPNPFSSSLRINASGLFQAGNTTVTLHDALGRQCASFKMNASEETISLEELDRGIYTLKINNGQKTVATRVVKQ